MDLEAVESPNDDLRYQSAAKGAAVMSRAEGIRMGKNEAYICQTSGGTEKVGQVFRLSPSRDRFSDAVELFFGIGSHHAFNSGDNLTVAPNGHLVVCEDQYTDVVDNYLRGLTTAGIPYDMARLRLQTELAGACFSPDG